MLLLQSVATANTIYSCLFCISFVFRNKTKMGGRNWFYFAQVDH